MGILVINHSHGLAKALLLHLKRHEAFQNIAIVLATDEPAGVAEALCARYAAHAYVSRANANTELRLLFGGSFGA